MRRAFLKWTSMNLIFMWKSNIWCTFINLGCWIGLPIQNWGKKSIFWLVDFVWASKWWPFCTAISDRGWFDRYFSSAMPIAWLLYYYLRNQFYITHVPFIIVLCLSWRWKFASNRFWFKILLIPISCYLLPGWLNNLIGISRRSTSCTRYHGIIYGAALWVSIGHFKFKKSYIVYF